MATVKALVETYLPRSFQNSINMDGGFSAVSFVNAILKDLAAEGLIDITNKKEVGRQVSHGYFMDIPADLVKILAVYDPNNDYTEGQYGFEIIGGKIKLEDYFGKDKTVNACLVVSVSLESAEVKSSTYGEDDLAGWLFETNNGEVSAIISSNDALGSPTQGTVSFVYPFDTLPLVTPGATGYFIEKYLVLKYVARWAGIASMDDEIPLEDKWENIVAAGLLMKSCSPEDTKKYSAYQQDYLMQKQIMKNEVFTPTEDQARAEPRYWPSFN